MTPSRVPSTLDRTLLCCVRWSSAASNCDARLSGGSQVEIVSMTNTTKPWDARRGPSHATADCVPRKPGETATAPNVPAVVLVG
jgi:hypothetical protein